tara:strand:+ start:25172 stop:26578 length:1407 start_codon:yes stop_codon:yes gene_type:complete
MKRTLLTLLSVICVVLTVNSQTVWEPIQNIDPNTGTDPYVIASGDLDGDTYIDIVIGTFNFSADLVKWYKNDGSGNFTLQPSVSDAGTLVGVGGITIADLDGINGNDIIVASYSNNTVMFYANDGVGGFATGVAITTLAVGAGEVNAVDINNDSNLDISVAAYGGNEAIWFPGNGDGTFGTKQVIASVALPGFLSFADFDNDGDQDALVGYTDGATSGTIEIYYNQYVESGTMTVSWIKDIVTVDSGNPYLFNTSFADVDDDGILEIIKSDNTTGEVAYYNKIKDGASTEVVISDETIIDRPAAVMVSDLDNDGFNDIILTDGGAADDALIWFESTDTGTFNPNELIVDNNYQMYSITVADFDNDGDKDIASIGYFSNTVDWYENALETLSVQNNILNSVKIYPNPTKDVLNFENINENIDVSVFDVLGKQVLEQTINVGETLNVSQLSNGIYTIKINNNTSSKFVKE